MKKHNFQMLGILEGEHCYSAEELALIVSRMFAWLPENTDIDLRNTTGRDLFQKSIISEHCKAFLDCCVFGNPTPVLEPWWWLVIRVRLFYAIDTLRSFPELKEGWNMTLTPSGVAEFVHSLLTLSWQVNGLRWLLLTRAHLPLLAR